MTINPEDVKLYESQRLTDEDDGGGRATGIEVIDGNVNNLFPDISRIDRTVGDVSLRKAFVGIATGNADVYLGAHAIIVAPPADPNVSVVMFDAGSEDDERLQAQQRIESYVVQGASAQWELMGNQYEGQRQVVGFQREDQPIPEVGDVYMLKDGNNIQYIRLTEVAGDVQTFTVNTGNAYLSFDRRRLDLGISAPLDYTFPGGEVKPNGPSDPHSEVFQTEVADAARYWGVTTAEEQVDIGDFMVTVPSIYSALVPSAQAESPLLDQPMSLQRRDVRPAASALYTQAITATYLTDSTIQAYLVRPAVRGTVALSLGGSTYVDNGSGILTRSSGGLPFAELEIEHDTGLITGTRETGTGSGDIVGSVDFTPGGVFSGKPLSLSEDVTLVNRGYNWVRTFPGAKPRPGTTVVSYMSLGKWYELRDPGNGVLEGVGTGTINFTTGTISVTTEALPDVDSAIIFSFVIDLADDVDERSGTLGTAGAEITVQCDPGIQPGSVVVSYTSGAVSKTLTDAANVGILAGDGTGHVVYGTGEVRFTPDSLPDNATQVTVDYDHASAFTDVIASPVFNGSGVISGTIPGAPLEPGTVELMGLVSYIDSYGQTQTRNHSMRDDGAGGWLYGLNSSLEGQAGVGTLDYATGAYTCQLLHNWTKYDRTYQTGSGYTSTSGVSQETSAGPVTIYYQPAAPSAAAGQTVQAVDQVMLTVIPSAGFHNLVPGTLMFTWGGELFIDRDGQVYKNFDSKTGAATLVGTINYNDRKLTLEDWPDAAPLGVDVLAAMTIADPLGVDRISFRTPGRPIRPQSMSITVTDVAGNLISETADVAGDFSSPSVSGHVNVETGVVDLVFNDGSPVYVYQDTARYSAVLFSFLPLDAELIGLNPVRLPSDGRVPVFREGDVVVLSHTADTDIGTPTDGQIIDLARDHQAHIIVEDDNGLAMDPAQYTVNLLAGRVTFESPVVLQAADTTPLVAPLHIKDRVEHMTVLNDVQITGELSFISACPHTLPANDTVVSSAKVWGDVNSRVFNFFTQRTWDSGSPNWTDSRIGDDTTANYDIVNNPIEYANNGAITEKWAIVFKSSGSFDVVGEQLGIIASGSTSLDLAPQNPNTLQPYFVIRAAGWGSGWSNGNVVRFDTEGCLAPVWIARTVVSGQAQEDDDQFILQIRGDAD